MISNNCGNCNIPLNNRREYSENGNRYVEWQCECGFNRRVERI